MWVITNLKNLSSDLSLILKNDTYYFYSNLIQDDVIKKQEVYWNITGHIIPRGNVNLHIKDQAKFLTELYNKNENSFIQGIKGNFVLIQLFSKGFKIYSDRFGIRKFFYWQRGRDFILSDNISIIVHQINAKPSPVCISIYAITYHFTGGRTLYDNIFHNTPAQIISFDGISLKHDYYWNPTTLLKVKKNDTTIEDIFEKLNSIIPAYLNSTGSEKHSLSLTGGADTRNLLALFLKNNIYPHLYTYGNPFSLDCVKAAKIAKELDLKHCIYNIHMSTSLFKEYAKKIIKISGGLSSIHRTHRLIAVEKEKEFADHMFLGTLGGEYIKGVNEDDYIVPPVVYDNWDKPLEESSLDFYFNNRFLINNKSLKHEVYSIIKHEPYMNGSIIERKFNALTYITAHLHDAQDINLFCSIMADVYTPFLDIDYLELLFSTQHTFEQKFNIGNKFIERINNPVFTSHFLNVAYRPLTKFLYSGEHKPSEVIFNKYYATLMKIIRQSLSKKHPPNFPLGKWMEDFVAEQLIICNDYEILKNTFDIKRLLLSLDQDKKYPKESFWLKYTNPIMMRFIIEGI